MCHNIYPIPLGSDPFSLKGALMLNHLHGLDHECVTRTFFFLFHNHNHTFGCSSPFFQEHPRPEYETKLLQKKLKNKSIITEISNEVRCNLLFFVYILFVFHYITIIFLSVSDECFTKSTF